MTSRTNDSRKKNWCWLHNHIIDDYAADMKPMALACYVYLCRRANDEDKCWPSQRTMAEDLGVDRSTVRSAVSRLVELKLIHVEVLRDEHGSYQSAIYTLLHVPEKEGGGGSLTQGGGSLAQGWVIDPKQEPVEQEVKEPSGNSSELPPRPAKKEKTNKPTIEAPTQEEYLERVERIREDDPLGEDLYSLVQLAASENKTNKMRPSRAWNEFVLPFTQKRDELPDEAWRVGFEAAINAGAGNLNYVCKVARKHQMAKGAEVVGIDGSKPKLQASPPALIAALENYEAKVGFFDLKRLADIAGRADLSQPEEQIPWPIRKQVSPDDRERGDVLRRVRKLSARLERGVS